MWSSWMDVKSDWLWIEWGIRMKSHRYKLVTPVAILIVCCLMYCRYAIAFSLWPLLCYVSSYMCAAVSTRLQRNSFVLCMSFGHFFCVWVYVLLYKSRTEESSIYTFCQVFDCILYSALCTSLYNVPLYCLHISMYASMSINGHFEFESIVSFPFVKARTKATQIKMKSNGK